MLDQTNAQGSSNGARERTELKYSTSRMCPTTMNGTKITAKGGFREKRMASVWEEQDHGESRIKLGLKNELALNYFPMGLRSWHGNYGLTNRSLTGGERKRRGGKIYGL